MSTDTAGDTINILLLLVLHASIFPIWTWNYVGKQPQMDQFSTVISFPQSLL